MKNSPKTSVTLSSSAEAMLRRNRYLENKSARISEILTRYGMLLNAYRNEYIDSFIHDPLVRRVVLEWGTVYPVPAIQLRDALGLVIHEIEDAGEKLPSKEKINTLFEESAKLSPMEQMTIVEAVEASAAHKS
jgi:hypothetical protein